MFTGLVEAIGILRRRAGKPVARALVECAFGDLVLGESINVNGACLTVDAIEKNGFWADLSPETTARTTLDELAIGAKVHLERATPLGGRMGGHVVLGHVDGVGRVTAREGKGEAVLLECAVPPQLERFLASKGSVAIDGVSLTLNRVSAPGTATRFDVMLVPHTLSRTLLGERKPGDHVNIEVDVLARYVARQAEVGGEKDAPSDDDQRLLAKLRAGGYA